MRSPALPSQSGIAHGVGGNGDGRTSAMSGGSAPEQDVGPARRGHRALREGAEGEAGDAERGRLLLHLAGVGDDRAGAALQREDVEVAERLDAAARRRPRARSRRLRARRSRVRGLTGKTTGCARRARRARRRSRPTGRRGRCSPGRCSETRTYSLLADAERRPRARRARGRLAAAQGVDQRAARRGARVAAPMPSATRLSSGLGAVREEQRRRSRSVNTRLISSGIVQSHERRPASTCATGSRAWPRRARRPERSRRRRRPRRARGTLEQEALEGREYGGRAHGGRPVGDDATRGRRPAARAPPALVRGAGRVHEHLPEDPAAAQRGQDGASLT